jgi:hypothetical protein
VIWPGLRHHHDVVEQKIRVRVRRDQHVGRNHVPRMQPAQNARILQLVRHGHGLHEAWNGLMAHRHLVFGSIGGDHFSAQLVNLEVLAGDLLRGRRRAGVAAGRQEKNEQETGNQWTHRSLSVQPVPFSRFALVYKVRLNSGVAMSSVPTPKTNRKSRS